MASLHAAIPRAGIQSQLHWVRSRELVQGVRKASTTPPPKPRVLEKPDKFRPPSHPARLKSKPRYTYGPELTQRQQTRRYPNMMPAEGTFLHWFLTHRTIHVWITLSILVSLIVGIWISDFLNSTPYLDLLPPNSLIFSHPLRFAGRWVEVYNMHVAHVSQQVAERREQKINDVEKRSEYRKAHGLGSNEGIFGGWTARSDPETNSPDLREGTLSVSQSHDGSTIDVINQNGGNSTVQTENSEQTYLDFEGNKQHVKKWFGIW